MIVAASVMLLLILSYFFQGVLEQKNDPARRVVSENVTATAVELTLQADRKGHFELAGAINGKPAGFLLDTGATFVAVPQKYAGRYGLQKGREIMISTANGRTTAYTTVIKQLIIGKIVLQNVKAVIHPNLEEILLGMSALKELEFIHAGGQLTIRQLR